MPKEYILIDSESIHVEAFAINENNLWELREYKSPTAKLTIKTIESAIALSDLYEGTKLL